MKIYYDGEPNKIWFAGGLWDRYKSFTSHRGINEIDIGQYNDISADGFISGCSLMAKSTMIKEIEMMQEDYFLYWQEVNWNATAVEHGWTIFFAPRSRIQHMVSSFTTDKLQTLSNYFMRSGLLYFPEACAIKNVPFFESRRML